MNGPLSWSVFSLSAKLARDSGRAYFSSVYVRVPLHAPSHFQQTQWFLFSRWSSRVDVAVVERYVLQKKLFVNLLDTFSWRLCSGFSLNIENKTSITRPVSSKKSSRYESHSARDCSENKLRVLFSTQHLLPISSLSITSVAASFKLFDSLCDSAVSDSKKSGFFLFCIIASKLIVYRTHGCFLLATLRMKGIPLVSGMLRQHDSSFGQHLWTFSPSREALITVSEELLSGASIECIASFTTVLRSSRLLVELVCESDI